MVDLLEGIFHFEQERNTTGYIVLDGSGNITDGKLDEEIDSTLTEHTAVTGNYTFNGLNGCDGTLTVQATGYKRTFNLSVTSLNQTTREGGSFSLLANGDNGDDGVYTGTKTQDPSTTNLAANSSMAKLTSNAAGGCTADMLNGLSFNSLVDGGTGENVRKGTIKFIFSNSGSQSGVVNVGVTEIVIVDGVLQDPLTTNYNGVVNPDCTVEVDSGTTKVGEFVLSHSVLAGITTSSAVTPAAAALVPPVDTISWDMPHGEWGKGQLQNW
ncbi:MAG TPA: hypothetical protein VK596_11155 [Edaphobacter sp.]|nr:hypothetical protein [Edaphobacter sp.]